MVVLLAGWLAFMGLFTYLLVPETKGIPIEDIESRFRGHWFWKRIMARTDARAAQASPTPQLELPGVEPVCKVDVVKVGGGDTAPKKEVHGVHRLDL